MITFAPFFLPNLIRLSALCAGSALAVSSRKSNSHQPIPSHLLKSLRLVDSSVFHALPRISWAHWRNFSKANSAIRLHLKFRLLDKKPSAVVVSKAKLCERKALETMIEPGEFYVGGRYYGRDYQFLKRLGLAGCSYVMRLYEKAAMKLIEELVATIYHQRWAIELFFQWIKCVFARPRLKNPSKPVRG